MDWWNVLIFGAIPVLTVAILFFVKRKLLWTAPLISAALAFVTYMIALAPITLEKLFNNNEWRGFFILAMLMHLGVVILLTVIAYLAAYILKRKRKTDESGGGLMKKYKKAVVLVLAILIALTAVYLIVPGFSKQGSAYIADYSVSEDGTEMTITVGVSSSIGYIRKVAEHQQHGGKLYLDCYSAFGGINGSWGAKTEYTIQIDGDTKMIALYRSPDGYEPVLEKAEDGEWQRVAN